MKPAGRIFGIITATVHGQQIRHRHLLPYLVVLIWALCWRRLERSQTAIKRFGRGPEDFYDLLGWLRWVLAWAWFGLLWSSVLVYKRAYHVIMAAYPEDSGSGPAEELPAGYDEWSVARKDAYWVSRRTPAQQAARDHMRQHRPDWRSYKCRRHPEVSLVLTLDPELLYCHLCLAPYRYDELVGLLANRPFHIRPP